MTYKVERSLPWMCGSFCTQGTLYMTQRNTDRAAHSIQGPMLAVFLVFLILRLHGYSRSAGGGCLNLHLCMAQTLIVSSELPSRSAESSSSFCRQPSRISLFVTPARAMNGRVTGSARDWKSVSRWLQESSSS